MISVVLACRPPKAATPAVCPPATAKTPTDTALPASGHSALAPTDSVELDGATECWWHGTYVKRADPGPLRLCFGVAGPCYAELDPSFERSDNALSLAVGRGPDAVIEVAFAGAVLRGKIAFSSLRFDYEPAAPGKQREFALFERFYAPEVVAPLAGQWRELEANFDPGDRHPRTLKNAFRRCDDLRLPGPHVVEGSLLRSGGLAPPKSPPEVVLRPGSVPLTVEPEDTQPVTVLTVTPSEDATVEVTERYRGRARVTWRRTGGTIVGWVPASLLAPRPPRPLTPPDAPRRAAGTPTAVLPAIGGYTCSRAVPLLAEINGVARGIGQLTTAAHFELLAPSPVPGTRGVRLLPALLSEGADEPHPDASLRLLPEASLLLPEADLVWCRRLAP